jgi:hypothetical protein
VKLRASSIPAGDNSRLLGKIDLVDDDLFDTAAGVTLRIQDVNGTDFAHHWDAGDCNTVGRFITCANGAAAGGKPPYQAKFGALPKQPEAVRASVRLIGLTHVTSPPAVLEPPFRGPITATLSYASKNGPGAVTRPGVVRDCKAGKASITCREP